MRHQGFLHRFPRLLPQGGRLVRLFLGHRVRSPFHRLGPQQQVGELLGLRHLGTVAPHGTVQPRDHPGFLRLGGNLLQLLRQVTLEVPGPEVHVSETDVSLGEVEHDQGELVLLQQVGLSRILP